jgi:hypothetical protein
MLCQQWWSVNKVFYKEATSSALNELLLAVPYLRANWKRIPSIIRLLSKIAKWNHDSKGWSSISYKKFLNAWGADYRRILEILRELGLLCIKRWVVTEDNKVKPNWRKKGTLGKEDKGHCYDFLLTPLCRARLGDHNKVYLHKLLTDKTERRKNQKRISRRGYNKLSYGDIRDNVKAMIDSSSYDEDAVNKVLETFIPMKREGVRYLLIQIAEKSYAPLKHNKKDNRLPNPYFELPPEIKELIKIKGLTSQYVGDIRSCYPSLWAAYVRGLILSKAKVGAPPIGYGNVDNEVERYNKFWLDPQIDPKKELSQLLDIPLDKVKDVVLKYYNGHTLTNDHYKRFDRWLQTEFPLLYRFWRKHTNIKETGNNIGKLFETPLMLDKSLFDKAEELGMVYANEADGFRLHAKDNSLVQEFVDFLNAKCLQILGIPLVFKEKKDTNNNVFAWVYGSKLERLIKLVENFDAKLKQIRGYCWATNHWDHYYRLRNERDNTLYEARLLYNKLRTSIAHIDWDKDQNKLCQPI